VQGIDQTGPHEGLAKEMAAKLGHVTILQKGAVDIISNGYEVIKSDDEGGLKRLVESAHSTLVSLAL
jgi:ATP-dependent NAD(P)H-hydrate dehydratase